MSSPADNQEQKPISDFNDLHVTQGLPEVRRQILSALGISEDTVMGSGPAIPISRENFSSASSELVGSSQSDQRDPPEIFECTDAGNADRIVHLYGKNLCFVPDLGGWHYWTGSHWKRDEFVARAMALAALREIHEEAMAAPSKEEHDRLAKWAIKSQSARSVRDARYLAEPVLKENSSEFNRELWLFPAKNGTVDLRTGELMPHDPGHNFTQISPIEYDAKAKAPIWHSFLERVLPDSELREFVQKAVGYSLTGLTVEQVLFFLYGFGRNGKSVFLQTIAAIFGDYHKATSIEMLSVGRTGSIPNDLAALVGIRFVTSSETPEGSRLNESKIKDMTGGESIQARFLHREFFQFQPQFSIWIAGNHKPQIRGTDDGIWRRVVLLPFTVQIPPEEVDGDLPEKLRAELPGILAWAVRGCILWRREGLKKPRIVADAVNEYRAEMDILGAFLEDCCVIGDSHQAAASDLYSAYKKWCADSGHQEKGVTRFGLSLRERGFEKRKPKKVVWHGVGLLDDLPEGHPENVGDNF